MRDKGAQVEQAGAGTGEQPNHDEPEDESEENVQLDSEGQHPCLNVVK